MLVVDIFSPSFYFIFLLLLIISLLSFPSKSKISEFIMCVRAFGYFSCGTPIKILTLNSDIFRCFHPAILSHGRHRDTWLCSRGYSRFVALKLSNAIYHTSRATPTSSPKLALPLDARISHTVGPPFFFDFVLIREGESAC